MMTDGGDERRERGGLLFMVGIRSEGFVFTKCKIPCRIFFLPPTDRPTTASTSLPASPSGSVSGNAPHTRRAHPVCRDFATVFVATTAAAKPRCGVTRLHEAKSHTCGYGPCAAASSPPSSRTFVSGCFIYFLGLSFFSSNRTLFWEGCFILFFIMVALRYFAGV